MLGKGFMINTDGSSTALPFFKSGEDNVLHLDASLL